MPVKSINLVLEQINKSDPSGNQYKVDHNTGAISLQLNDETRWRNIGWIEQRSDRIIYRKQDKESQRFRKTDAWSIPYYILKNVDGVMIVTEENVYKILTEQAMNVGQFFHFKNSTEKKIYIPVDQFWKAH